MDHVLIRKLEHLTGNQRHPELGYAIEMRDRPGPAHKMGAFESDVVWVQLHGGLFVAKARVEICWRGEFSSPEEIRMRVRDAPIHNVVDFWTKRPRFGYAAVAEVSSTRPGSSRSGQARAATDTSGSFSRTTRSTVPGWTSKIHRAAALN